MSIILVYLKTVIFAGTKFCRYQILGLTLYLRSFFTFDRMGGSGQLVPAPCVESCRQVLWSPNLAQIYINIKRLRNTSTKG